jgi:hypothetical protein
LSFYEDRLTGKNQNAPISARFVFINRFPSYIFWGCFTSAVRAGAEVFILPIHHHWIPQGPVDPSLPWQTLQSDPTVPQWPPAVAVLQNLNWQVRDEDEAFAGLAVM